ncbi:hypothetical protein F4782DRAFT_526914 [Xylaria castorea]|nr:hypothetical protein F4782DRAFT_526914 [Xylaria castorea]
MSSSSSSRVSSLPYDPIRPNHIGEAPTTYPNPMRSYANTSVMSEFSGITLYRILKKDEYAEQTRREAMMAQMDWNSHSTVSSTHPQAKTEILVQNALDWVHNYPQNLFEQNVPHSPDNDVYGIDADPHYDQENVPPVYDANYFHGRVENNSPIPAGNDVYGNDIAPMDEQENIPPNYATNYPYGSIIIPDQIAPLRESLLNSAPTVLRPQGSVYNAYYFSSDQRAPLSDITFLPYPQVENHNNHSETGQREQIWEDGNDQSIHTSLLQELERLDSPEIKIEPVENENYHASYSGFYSSPHVLMPRGAEIHASIESDDAEESYSQKTIQHMKRERVEESGSSAYSTIGTYASANSHGSTNTSMTSYRYDADDVINRYF